MSNSNIEETLIGIEQNLEKLESARRQVLDVTQSGRQITSTMVQLARSVDEVYKVINLEADSFGKNLEGKKNDFNARIDKIEISLKSSILSYLDQLNTFTTTVSDNLNASAANAAEATKNQIAKQETAFEKHISNIYQVNELLENFKKNLSHFDFKSELRPLEGKIDLNQANIVSSLNNGIITLQRDLIDSAKLGKDQLTILQSDQKQALSMFSQQLKERSLEETAHLLKIQSNQENAFSLFTQQVNERIQDAGKKNKISNYITWTLLATIIVLKLIFK